MVEAGEAAGILDEVLDRLATQIEKEANIKRRVKGALVYPILVLSFSFLVLTAMLLFIVPIFQKLYGQLGGTLPTLTQVIVNLSELMRTRWYLVFPQSRSRCSAFSAGSGVRAGARCGTPSSFASR
jgi:type IV pilus assembly protein PilC